MYVQSAHGRLQNACAVIVSGAVHVQASCTIMVQTGTHSMPDWVHARDKLMHTPEKADFTPGRFRAKKCPFSDLKRPALFKA